MFLIFDTETTGLPLRNNAPIEDLENWPRVVQLAWQRHDEKGTLVEARNLIIRPDGFVIPYAAEKVHGISTQKARDEGVPLKEALQAFEEAVEQVVYIVGHNIDFDIKVIAAELMRAGISTPLMKKPHICTMKSTVNFCRLPGGRSGKFKSPKLEELYHILFNESFSEAHNASADVLATARIFFELYRKKVIDPVSLEISPGIYQQFIAGHQDVVPPFEIELESNHATGERETR